MEIFQKQKKKPFFLGKGLSMDSIQRGVKYNYLLCWLVIYSFLSQSFKLCFFTKTIAVISNNVMIVIADSI
jgi:hypothetical protein